MASFSFLSPWAGEKAAALWMTCGPPCVELVESRWQKERPELSGNLGPSQAVEVRGKRIPGQEQGRWVWQGISGFWSFK